MAESYRVERNFRWWFALTAKIVAALVVALFIVVKSAHASTGLTLFVVNQSSVVTNGQLQDALPVIQDAVSHDFAGAWGVDAALYLTDTPPAGSWQLHVQDDSTMCGLFGCALGYHDVLQGSPIGYVFAASSSAESVGWDEVFTHELFEMLADPWLNRLALGTRLWLVEVCDPVVDATYPRVTQAGVVLNISDFVTQQWYRKKGKPPFDFASLFSRPGQLTAHGYASYWTRTGWQQMFRGARG
jgi:hypothetical protein